MDGAPAPPAPGATASSLVRRVAVAHDEPPERWLALVPEGAVQIMHATSPCHEAMATGMPVWLDRVTPDRAEAMALSHSPGDLYPLVAERAYLAVPIVMRGRVLGCVALTRRPERAEFDEVDVLTVGQLAAQAALGVDNARLFRGQVAAAAEFRRGVLPTAPPTPGRGGGRAPVSAGESGGRGRRRLVRHHRAARQPGGDRDRRRDGPRRALGGGDGAPAHRGADAGRPGPAARTVAAPARQPGPATRATTTWRRACTRSTTRSRRAASSPTPAICRRCWCAPTAAWSGSRCPAARRSASGGVAFDTAEIPIRDGDVLVLYTDGLVEARGDDIDDRIEALGECLELAARPAADPEALCDTLLTMLDGDKHEDDVALLAARLKGIPAENIANWLLAPLPPTVPRARRLVRQAMAQWDLPESVRDTTELLATELVTNAVRYAHGPIELRLLRTRTLLCEVRDDDHFLPILLEAGDLDEGGRGLFLVSQLALRWGVSRTANGKVVWFEMALEEGWG